MKELTMILMYLSRFNENNRAESSIDMVWKEHRKINCNEQSLQDILTNVFLGVLLFTIQCNYKS